MTVDVWLAAVPPDAHVEALRPFLSADERARADRFRHDPSRNIYIAAHVLLRRALTARAGPPIDAWRFNAGPTGRPFIDGPAAFTRLAFSLTHCTGLAACAIAEDVQIGIDAEDTTRRPDINNVVRHFSEDERERLYAITGAEERQAAVQKLWTLKEAFVKARGVGLSFGALSDVSFAWPREGEPEPSFGAGCNERPEEWSFRSWSYGRFVLACAVNVQPGTATFVDRRPGVSALAGWDTQERVNDHSL